MSEENMNVNPEVDTELEQPAVEIATEAVDARSAKKRKSLKKRRAKKVGIIIAVAVVVVAALVAGVMFVPGLISDSKKADSDIGIPKPSISGGGGGSCNHTLGGGGNGKGDTVEDNPERDDFIDDIGGVSETFEGTVSMDSYYSANDAAEAFVYEELSGTGSASVISVQSNGELSDGEIEKLNIPDEVLEGADAVEELIVEYSVWSSSSYSARATERESSGEVAEVKVYVIKYGVDWKYFSPLPETGETINKSYYDSVFDYEKYKNCTFEVTQDVEVYASAEGQTMSITMHTYQLVKYADDRIYLEQTVSTSENGYSESSTIYAYLEQGQYGIDCYIKMSENSSWMKASMSAIGFSSLDELTPFYDQYLDYTYFVKTNYGFAIPEENAKRYFEQALGAALEGIVDMNMADTDLGMYAEYYVADGALSGMMIDAHVNMTISEDGITGTIRESITSVAKCTDYGTTVVERPL